MSFNIDNFIEAVEERIQQIKDLQKHAVNAGGSPLVLQSFKLALQYLATLQDAGNMPSEMFYVYARACWLQGAGQTALKAQNE